MINDIWKQRSAFYHELLPNREGHERRILGYDEEMQDIASLRCLFHEILMPQRERICIHHDGADSVL